MTNKLTRDQYDSLLPHEQREYDRKIREKSPAELAQEALNALKTFKVISPPTGALSGHYYELKYRGYLSEDQFMTVLRALQKMIDANLWALGCMTSKEKE